MRLNIWQLMDDPQYYAVRDLRWPEGINCPECGSAAVNKRGFHDHQTHHQRYSCQDCGQQFDDLSGTFFEGHRQSLKMWILCLYLMGLNLSNRQIAAELEMNYTHSLLRGIVVDTVPFCAASSGECTHE